MSRKFKECTICKKKFGKKQILDHYLGCLTIKNKDESGIILILTSYSELTNNNYYLFIKVGNETRLKDLDKFLRGKWLGCCNHRSDFCDDVAEYNINKKIISIKNTELLYRFDYGTESIVEIIIGNRLGGDDKNNDITILLESEKPFIKCTLCDADAEYIIHHKFYCKKDSDTIKYNKDADYKYIVNNSPRIGKCSYMYLDEECTEEELIENKKEEELIENKKEDEEDEEEEDEENEDEEEEEEDEENYEDSDEELSDEEEEFNIDDIFDLFLMENCLNIINYTKDVKNKKYRSKINNNYEKNIIKIREIYKIISKLSKKEITKNEIDEIKKDTIHLINKIKVIV
jgi:hypothetical protein